VLFVKACQQPHIVNTLNPEADWIFEHNLRFTATYSELKKSISWPGRINLTSVDFILTSPLQFNTKFKVFSSILKKV